MMLFKNCILPNLSTGEIQKVDILTDNGKIVEISKRIEAEAEIIDLSGDILLPPFCNCYYNSFVAFCNSYLNQNFCCAMTSNDFPKFSNGIKELTLDDRNEISKFMAYKNLLAGAYPFFDYANVKNLSSFDLNNSFMDEFCSQQLCLFETAASKSSTGEEYAYVENLHEVDDKDLEEFCLRRPSKVVIKAGQTLEEMGRINAQSHIMPSEYLESYGLLDKEAILVGANCFEKDEINLLSGYDTKFVILPNDDARSGRRLPNLNLLKTLDVGIGSGGYAEIDFFAFMRQIMSFNSYVMEQKGFMDELQVLRMATVQGAKLYGIDSEIKVGGVANFIVLSSDSILSSDIISGIVYEMSNKDIHLMVYDGKIIFKNGKFAFGNDEKYVKIIECIKRILRRN